ncbi:MAG: hypothetical protein JJD97_00930 [Gemmatimonadaceae bacterium]|nr:hypothetical protein [Gemmatimonadaceae bacterium]
MRDLDEEELMGVHGRNVVFAGAVSAALLLLAPAIVAQSPAASATIEKPKARSASTGSCRILENGTLSGNFGRSDLLLLGFTIGPKAAMAAEMHAKASGHFDCGAIRKS